MKRIWIATVICVVLGGCSATLPPKQSEGHLTTKVEKNKQSKVPLPVSQAPFVPLPTLAVKQEVYTVVVNGVSVKELMFALARDAKMNVDIHPGITGEVTINAIKQTLIQILNRIAEQVSIRYVVDGNNLVISPDLPFFRSYKINYVNMSRNSTNTVSVATEVATTGQGPGGSSGVGNLSKTSVSSSSNNDFWATLVTNIGQILAKDTIANKSSEKGSTKENKDQKSAGSSSKGKDKQTASAGAGQNVLNRIISNPLSGILAVKATQHEHRDIQHFIDQVMANVQRQVLIEATIVEVELSDRYQAGIDWQGIASKGATALTAGSNMIANNLASEPNFLMSLVRETTNFNLSMGVGMLEAFGDVKVLSSPKIIALNNQTALLKVVDEKVYFETNVEIKEDVQTNRLTSTVSTKIRTVPVGMTMSVTPQINSNGIVTMNIRPTITRITRYVSDPTPQLQRAIFNNSSQVYENLVPEIQVREIESLLQVRDGQTVILGGLMQNKETKRTTGIPYLSALPYIGGLFRYQDEELIKTELVIFLRPVVIRNANANRELNRYRRYLPAPVASGFRDEGRHPERNRTIKSTGVDHESFDGSS